MRRTSIVLFSLVITILISRSIAAAQPQVAFDSNELPDPANETAVRVHMEKLLEKNRHDPEWPADMHIADVLVADWRLNRCYSRKDGLREMKTEKVKVNPKEQDTIADIDERTVNSLIGTNYKTYPVYRQIRSIPGTTYDKVSAYITLGLTTGVDGYDIKKIQCDEGAFNYFGLATSTGVDVECGLCTQHHMNHTESNLRWDHAGRWYVYRSYYTGTPNWKQFMTDPPRPAGGYPAGTEVFMKMWVGADGALMAYYSCTDPNIPPVGEINYTVNENPPLIVPDVSYTFRRTTSMVVGGRASSVNNQWRNTKIGIVGGVDHDWDASKSNNEVFHDFASWVTPRNQVVNRDETITIRVPVTSADRGAQ